MTREEAENIVLDLIQSVRDFEHADRFQARHYRQDYEAMREAVIEALIANQQAGLSHRPQESETP